MVNRVRVQIRARAHTLREKRWFQVGLLDPRGATEVRIGGSPSWVSTTYGLSVAGERCKWGIRVRVRVTVRVKVLVRVRVGVMFRIRVRENWC